MPAKVASFVQLEMSRVDCFKRFPHIMDASGRFNLAKWCCAALIRNLFEPGLCQQLARKPSGGLNENLDLLSRPFEQFWTNFAMFCYLYFTCIFVRKSKQPLSTILGKASWLVDLLDIVDIVCHRARCAKVGVEPTECSRSTCKPGQPGRAVPDRQSFAELCGALRSWWNLVRDFIWISLGVLDCKDKHWWRVRIWPGVEEDHVFVIT